MNSNLETTFPIRILSERTGVGSTTLRAWERRYGLLKPLRTPKGHRLYRQSDINRVNQILNWLKDGHSFKVIAGRLAGSELPEQENLPELTESESIWSQYVTGSLQAVADFSVERLEAVYHEASSLYPLDMVNDKLILPILGQLGERWITQADSGIAEEHFYTSWLRGKLSARLYHAYGNARGSRIVCACLPESFHETGLLMFALSALSRGYRVLYFGANLPLSQLPHILTRSAAKAVVLSAQGKIDDTLSGELKQLTANIAQPVFIGGKGLQANQKLFESMDCILLGEDIPVAMHVLESHVPVYSARVDSNA